MASHMKKQAIDYSRIACSFHESGHVCIALLNFMQVSDVAVKIDGTDAVGLTSFYIYQNGIVEDPELYKELIISDLRIAYAGFLAERHYYRDISGSQRFPNHLKYGSSEDIAVASGLIRKNGLATPGKNTTAFKKNIQSEVEQTLVDNWEFVKIIAHALIKHKSLLYSDIKNILSKKNSKKDFWKEQFKIIDFIHNDNNVPLEAEVKKIVIP